MHFVLASLLDMCRGGLMEFHLSAMATQMLVMLAKCSTVPTGMAACNNDDRFQCWIEKFPVNS